MSNFKVFTMMAGLTALLIWMGHALGGNLGILLMAFVSAGMNLITFFYSDKIVLKMTRAQPVTAAQAPELYEMTERLSQRAGIPMPRLFIVPDPSPNAFATGRSPKHGVVAVNEGLMRLLNRDELEGVVAHEIAHIRHRDTLTSAIVATVAGAISALANIAIFASWFMPRGDDGDGPHPLALLFMTLIAPIAAMLVQFAVSRAREFEADKSAAQYVGNARGLQGALLKLERGVTVNPSHVMQPSQAHMCIVNPFGGAAMKGFAKLFSTHPPIQERVARLEQVGKTL